VLSYGSSKAHNSNRMNVQVTRRLMETGLHKRAGVWTVVGWLWILAIAWGDDWPQYRGSNHDGVSNEKILTNWAASSPRRIWRVPLTDGFSSFAVVGGKAFTLVSRSLNGADQEVCVALDAETGEELWATPVGQARYDSGGNEGTSSNSGGDGPRSTPSVYNGCVYVLTAYLVLDCLDIETGLVLWSKDLCQQYGGRLISWQNAASPLIEGGRVIVNTGAAAQSLLALNAADGSLAWRSQTNKMTHSTPVAATILGTRQIVFYTQSGLVSVRPESGDLLWRYTIGYNGVSAAASPVVAGDVVYFSAAYNTGGGAVRISNNNQTWVATPLWPKSKLLMNNWCTPVHCNGYLYGVYGEKMYGSAALKCVELATGTEKWSCDGYGMGGVILVDGRLLVLNDRGELVIVEANPDAYIETARYPALAGKCWNVPVVSNGRIYARSTKEGVCLDVAVQPPAPLRLQPPMYRSDGGIQLLLGNADGSAVDSNRLANIEVLAATRLISDLTNWTRLNLTPTMSNGLWFWADPESSTLPQRFYRVIEKP
jgi:outer membrane protein assembly factor BamB